MKHKKFIAIGMVTIYIVCASIMCIPMAVTTHEGLSLIGIESQLVELECIDKENYGHCAIQINEVVYEPRYLGMYKQSNINYEPVKVFRSTDELISEYHFLPSVTLLIKSISEMVNN